MLNKSDADLDRLELGLKIDKNDLDNELMDQAYYFYQAARRFADAISYRDEAKADLEGIKAKVGLQIRQQFSDAGEKITEGGVDARVIANPEYQKALDRMAAWTDRVVRWTGLRDSIQQRGYALKDLTALYIAGYWADRAGSQASREVKGDRAAAGREVIANKARERRRLPEESAA